MMKNIFIKIAILFITFMILNGNAYATEENMVENNTQTEEVTQEKPTETEINEKMYVQERCNIRAGYSTDSDRVGGLDAGTEVTVVAEYSNGWYKINYEGGEAYIKAGILRSTKPEVPEEPEENVPEEQPAAEQENQQNQADVTSQNTIENSEEVDVEMAELINEIGVLPEVGKNIADYLYVGVIILAMMVIGFVKYKF